MVNASIVIPVTCVVSTPILSLVLFPLATLCPFSSARFFSLLPPPSLKITLHITKGVLCQIPPTKIFSPFSLNHLLSSSQPFKLLVRLNLILKPLNFFLAPFQRAAYPLLHLLSASNIPSKLCSSSNLIYHLTCVPMCKKIWNNFSTRMSNQYIFRKS